MNSPMAASATSVYARHQDELRLTPAQCKALVHSAQIVHTLDESLELSRRHGPMIIIAASGMATGGRVLHHLKAFAPDKRNTVLCAGFQAGGTRGATISGGAATVRFSEKTFRFAPKWRRCPTFLTTRMRLKSSPDCRDSNRRHARLYHPRRACGSRCDVSVH
jgi:Cft2 family RNA processing exonuclease